MEKKFSRVLSLGLCITLTLSLCSTGLIAAAADSDAGGGGGGGGGFPGPPSTSTSTTYSKVCKPWVYSYTVTKTTDNSTGAETTSQSDATITSAYDDVKTDSVTLIPSTLGGISVTAFGTGSSVMTNNGIANNYVIFADGMKTLSKFCAYDYNKTAGWVIPSSVTSMPTNALSSCSGSIYGISESAAETYATATSRTFVALSGSTQSFTVTAGTNGTTNATGSYSIPDAVFTTAGTYTAPISITPNSGYKIDSIVVDGTPITDVTVNGKLVTLSGNMVQDCSIAYTFDSTKKDHSVNVTFTALDTAAGEKETRTFDDTFTYTAPTIDTNAVAAGATLPSDVNTYAPDTTGEAPNKYSSSMNVTTGTYYTFGGTIYQMVYVTQNERYSSKAEVINAMYKNRKLVYGKDYDYIRLFNYVHNYANGPRPGDFHIYGCYLYKSTGKSTLSGATTNSDWEAAYQHMDSSKTDAVIQGDVATLFVQKGSQVTFDSLISHDNTIAYGPSEAANFYGLGSSVLVDGGDTKANGTFLGQIRDYTDSSTSSVVLNNPTIVGTENVIYAVAGGVGHLNGGRYFGSSSGGHGLYVGMGGQITMNASSSNGILDSKGNVQTDYSYLKNNVLDVRPATDLGTATSAELSSTWNAYAQPVYASDLSAYASTGKTAIKGSTDDIAILVTADETGTALTTDTGGGTIVANRLSATTYGRGCAGVYSIGADESLVYVFNSALHSNADAALCSASSGYIFAFNCELTGVDGLKSRSGGTGTLAGIKVYNSKVVSSFNPDNYSFYHMSKSTDTWDSLSSLFGSWSWADDKSLVNCPMLNLFINKTSYKFKQDISKEQSYWYKDKNTAPQTGEGIAPILFTGTSSVESHSNYYYNENYASYQKDGAKNNLIVAENGGTATVNFYDQNSSTKWDLTGVSNNTTELYGNISIAETVTATGPDAGSGASSANVNFNNSEWSGAVVGYSANAKLSLDAASKWTVTADCTVASLTLADHAKVIASSFKSDSATVNSDGTTTYKNAVLGAATSKASNIYSNAVLTGSVLVTSIKVSAANFATSVTAGQTLQMSADVLPSTATDKSITWSITNGTGSATISTAGLLTGSSAGTVTVTATAKDDSATAGSLQITVTAAASSNTSGSSGGSSSSGGASVGTRIPVVTQTVWENPFADVSQSDWYYSYVQFAVSNGLMKGTDATNFNPLDGMTRAMFVTILYRLAGSPSVTGANSFTDVEQGAWYADAVSWVAENSIVLGNGDHQFTTNASITREQMAVIFYRYAQLNGKDANTAGDLTGFSDASQISSYAKTAMEWAVSKNILNGSNGALLPTATATRAETAAMMQRFLVFLQSK
jgi:hypothetical protein